MTRTDQDGYEDRTTSAMQDTADELEQVEDRLHHIAEESPDPAITIRVHLLGDRVTAQAKDIERRAGRLRDLS